MSDVRKYSDSEFYYPKEKKKEKKIKKREKRGGHMIKCLLTELGRAGRENIWSLGHGARSVHHDNGSNIFLSGTPTQSISTYSGSAHANAYGPHTGIFSIALQ